MPQYDGGSLVELEPELEAAQRHSAELDVTIGSLRTDLKRNTQRIEGLEQSLHIARLRQQSLIGALEPFDEDDDDEPEEKLVGVLAPFDDDEPEEKPRHKPSCDCDEVVY